jgi:hypothetical protein
MSVNFAGIVPNNYPVNTRILIDANYVANVALPNVGNTASTAALNLLNAVPFPVTETINVQVVVGAATGTANSKNINVVMQHTTANADGTANTAAWANIPTLAIPILTTTDNAGAGNPGGSATFKLPPLAQEFIRAEFIGEANGGVAVLGTGTLQLLF